MELRGGGVTEDPLPPGARFNMAELDTTPREEELSDSVTRAPRVLGAMWQRRAPTDRESTAA